MQEEQGALPQEVTALLAEWSDGDDLAFAEVIERVYLDLHQAAHRIFRGEAADRTLQATALVGEVYLRLKDYKKIRFKNREHFFGVAARVMRHVVIEYARASKTEKRGGGLKTELDEDSDPIDQNQPDLDKLISVDQALRQLDSVEPRQSRIATLRFFAGMNLDEIAEILLLSPTTVKREWSKAKRFLFQVMAPNEESDEPQNGA